MKTILQRARYRAILLLLVMCHAHRALATGITADVGLTPPVDRWIFRSQLRYVERDDPTSMGRQMKMYMAPLVLAYGVSPEITAIVRQPLVRREMKMPAARVKDTGIADLAIIGKYRLLRINDPNYIVGIAPTLGVELPTGDDDISADTWDILTGLYFSGRRGPLGADLNLEYKSTGIEDRSGNRPGDESSATFATAYQFSLNDTATMSLWPVVEFSYMHESRTRSHGNENNNSGEDVLLIASGAKFAYQSFMVELLIQFPVAQNQNGNQTEREPGGLFGIRYLF